MRRPNTQSVSDVNAAVREEGHLLMLDLFAVDVRTVHGRMAARAYAYSVAAERPDVANAILNQVGREG